MLSTNILFLRRLVWLSVNLVSLEQSALQYENVAQPDDIADPPQNHPISDLPAFFIHPCNTAEALEAICQDRSCSAEAYILIWLGLVGPPVDLYIPSQLLLTDTTDKMQAP